MLQFSDNFKWCTEQSYWWCHDAVAKATKKCTGGSSIEFKKNSSILNDTSLAHKYLSKIWSVMGTEPQVDNDKQQHKKAPYQQMCLSI